MSNTSQWFHFHHHTNSSTPPPPASASQPADNSLYWPGGQQLSSEPTLVSTTTNPPAQPLAPADGRVSKPTRRRTRASRRAPTTLLNTDPTNFRAMVQQFTGGPATSFGFGPPQPTARWNPADYGIQQFQNYGDHQIISGGGGSSSSYMVQHGAGGEGGEVVFGNINVGSSSSGANRTTNNMNVPGFPF